MDSDSKHNPDEMGDCPPSDLYTNIRKLPQVAAPNVVLKVSSSSANRKKVGQSNPAAQQPSANPFLDPIKEPSNPTLQNEGGGEAPRKATQPRNVTGGDGAIRVPSLSSNAHFLTPETNKNQPLSGVPRPRTAFAAPARKYRPPTPTPTSARSFQSVSTLPSSINTCHAAIGPADFIPGPGSWMSSRSSSRATFDSSMTVNKLPNLDAVRQGRFLRKKFQVSESLEEEESCSYNEWRVGMEDPTEEARDLYDLSEMFYYVEKDFPPQSQIEEGVDPEDACTNRYNLLVGRIAEYNLDFVKLPTPPGFLVQCLITRVNNGLEGKMYPTYFLHLERKGHPELLLLTARRTSLLKMQYVISTNPGDMSTHSPTCAGILESNLRGSEFVLKVPVKPDYIDTSTSKSKAGSRRGMWERFFALKFESNTLGIKGPRSLSVAIPKLKSDWEQCHPASLAFSTEDTDYVAVVKNRAPKWSNDSCTYVLNFSTRVQRSSVKNFQLAHQDKDEDLTVLQFGRRHKDDTFILDFNYPFCPLQAFAIALSSFDCKWGTD